MSYELTCIKGSMSGRRWTIPATGLKIGSAVACEVCLADGAVDAYHCVLEVSGESVSVNNLASDAGVNVNGAFVRNKVLSPSDVIRVGDEQFIVTVAQQKGTAPGLAKVLPWLLLVAVLGFVVYQQFSSKAVPAFQAPVPSSPDSAGSESPKPEVPEADEATFIQSLRAVYSDGEASEQELVEIETKRKACNVAPARALELEKLVQAIHKKDSPDAKYYDFLVELVKQGKTIEAEQEALKKLRNDLKLSQERVKQLEDFFPEVRRVGSAICFRSQE